MTSTQKLEGHIVWIEWFRIEILLIGSSVIGKGTIEVLIVIIAGVVLLALRLKQVYEDTLRTFLACYGGGIEVRFQHHEWVFVAGDYCSDVRPHGFFLPVICVFAGSYA